ncbi:S9 family peptidase [Thalassomonas viridans]|uniref:S9 family peptidase n=1 Tax=Thalassomonas viridans TaxID=137584 RepID=A0AAF0CAK6_9GAMM|nr:S9 family peptidase [Thalassomonas viridans]WDE06405.1 S9 family peptidase [Thalassomonas viridans]
MKNILKTALIASALSLAGISASQAEQLTIERIYSSPSLNGPSPKSLTFSPDGSRVTYLQGKTEDLNRYDLWEYNLASKENKLLVDSQELFSGKEVLSDEEKARRERQRIYGQGIMEYKFSKDGTALLFPLNGDIYYYDLASKTSKRLTKTPEFETDVKFSPKGKYVSFIREQNIYAINIKSGKEIQLTTDGKGTIKNGMAEFVAQEEMDRMTGYWWSPNEKHIAFLRVDESPVQTVIRNEIYAEEIKLIEQRYPATGSNNVKIQLATVDLEDQDIRFIDTGKEQNIYLPRVKWLPNSKSLSYQWQSRDQKTLKLNLYNLKSRKQKTLLTENSDHWINLHHDLKFLKDSKSFIWASERDGFKHLYHFDIKGKLITQLSKGEWVVDSLKSVDEENGWVYFTGRADTPLERHLYKVPLDGKAPEHVVRVTKRNGFHSITFSRDNRTYIDKFSNIQTPQQVSLHQVNGEHITWLEQNQITDSHPLKPYYEDIVMPEFGSLQSDDGKATLYYKLFKPKNMVPGKKYPVIVNVYGGPHAQRVTNKWQGAAMSQYMVQQGYIVYQLDNRGSNYRGTAFEFPIYENLGVVEVADQISGVKFLHTLPYVDKERIGIFGHSYGGYMALMTMFKAGEYFKAGVSGAPVTDWLLYDTHYTERYLNHPQSNAFGYQQSSVFPYVSGLQGPLMVYHGMADDNVLFTNTTKLIKSLQDENKVFELMTYPGSKHSMRGKKVKVHLNNTIMGFFNRHFNVTPALAESSSDETKAAATGS